MKPKLQWRVQSILFPSFIHIASFPLIPYKCIHLSFSSAHSHFTRGKMEIAAQDIWRPSESKNKNKNRKLDGELIICPGNLLCFGGIWTWVCCAQIQCSHLWLQLTELGLKQGPKLMEHSRQLDMGATFIGRYLQCDRLLLSYRTHPCWTAWALLYRPIWTRAYEASSHPPAAIFWCLLPCLVPGLAFRPWRRPSPKG